MTTLNAQIPKYNLVVAAQGCLHRGGDPTCASVLNTAVDWPKVLSQLFLITPTGAEVEAINGTEVAPTATTGSASSSTTTAATSSKTPPSKTTTSAAIGTLQFGVTGPGPSLSISEAWIDAVAGSPYFANPLQGATVVNADSTISFPFSVSVTPAASLSQNASEK